MSPVLCFSGPSLTPRAAQAVFPEAHCLGPAAQGDVYRACLAHRPQALCLIDGYFEHRPAVSHKELLWALQQGITVYGAASMGALRAVELAPFGMRGWGDVYELYATGAVEDDDEVAIVHAPAEQDYVPRSEALVNIRRNLDAARMRGLLSRAACMTLIAYEKAAFYAERNHGHLLTHAATFMSKHEVDALRSWLSNPSRYRDSKRHDAETLLVHVRESWRAGRLPVTRAHFEFAETDAWVSIKAGAHDEPQPQTQTTVDTDTHVPLAQLIEELQLSGPEQFDEAIRVATWRALCLSLQRASAEPTAHDDASIDAKSPDARQLVLRHVPGALRALGVHAQLEALASAKWQRKQSGGDAGCAAVDPARLAAYFSQRLQRAVPEDLSAYAQGVGFENSQALLEAIGRDLAGRFS